MKPFRIASARLSLAYNAPPGMNSGTSYSHFNLEEAQP